MSLEKVCKSILPLEINNADVCKFISLVHQDQTHKRAHVQDADTEKHVYKLLINGAEKQEIIFSLYIIRRIISTITLQSVYDIQGCHIPGAESGNYSSWISCCW